MSYDDYDDWDAGREEYELEIENRAIEEFQSGRLQSFYKANKDLALKPINMRKEAVLVLEKSPSAAMVLAVASIEVGFKAIIVRPIISGLVHEESLASLVTDVFVKGAKEDGALAIVYQVLKKYASIDLRAITLANHGKSYWMELSEARKLRNAVLHKAETCSSEDAEHVIELADYLWNVIFVEIIESVGLHSHDNQTVCGEHKSLCDGRAMMKEMERLRELRH
jgi:hypothetical protein